MGRNPISCLRLCRLGVIWQGFPIYRRVLDAITGLTLETNILHVATRLLPASAVSVAEDFDETLQPTEIDTNLAQVSLFMAYVTQTHLLHKRRGIFDRQ